MATTPNGTGALVVTALDLHHGVNEMVNDANFVAAAKSNKAPLPMLAFAKIVVDSILRPKEVDAHQYFDGMTMTVPAVKQFTKSPEYHSTAGQKLLYVDWNMYGLRITCRHCKQGVLRNDRTNFSKNKILFPIFGIDGPLQWAMVMSMTCPCCRHRVNANASEVLCDLPAYTRGGYPVESKYALNKNSHIGVSATTVFNLLMPTYGNGDLCSRLLYHAINRLYAQKVEDYYSYGYTTKKPEPREGTRQYVELHGEYIRTYPPTGDGIRNTYDKACSNSHMPWNLSDHDRHVREIQKVGCRSIFAQDHTHKVTDNYYQKKSLGAFALWDCANENGEIASAVLVPTTKTIHFAHAAKALTRRERFTPSAMYSDTWPAKSTFWNLLFGDKLQGRLGLFHYIQRITRTLKKNHIDH